MSLGLPGLPKPPSLPFNLGGPNAADLAPETKDFASLLKTDKSTLKEPILDSQVQTVPIKNWNSSGQYVFSIMEQDGTSHKVFEDNFVALRIPPQSIQITTTFASSVIATNNGILEEHNGSIFSMISIAGTTGLLPDRKTSVVPPTGAAGVATALGNAIAPAATAAITGLVKGISRTLEKLGIKKAEEEDLTRTGYFQFWALHHLFKRYAAMKKRKGYEDIRLAFSSVKDGVTYLCMPVSFEMRRDSSAPMLYRYAISLKAWKVVKAIPDVKKAELNLPEPNAPSLVAAYMNLLNTARRTIDEAFGVLSAINSDWVRSLQAYEQTQLFGQELGGLGRRFNEYIDAFKKENTKKFVEPIQNQTKLLEALNKQGKGASLSDLSVTSPSDQTSGSTRASLRSVFNDRTQASSTATSNSARGIASQSLEVDSQAAFDDALNAKVTPGGETDIQKSNTAIPSAAAQLINEALELIRDSNLDEYEIHPDIQAQIDKKIEEAQQIDANDVRNLISDLKKTSNAYAQSINASNTTYEAIYDVPSISITTKPQPTEDDILLGVALQESITVFTAFLATGQMFPEQEKDPFAVANQNLETDSQMDSANSAYPIVFPRGSTLAMIAQRYLGDSTREHEIALLNNLKAPFIDEAGFEQSIFGAVGRTFVVNGKDNLAINQRITLRGNSLADSKRTIINIEDIGGGKFKVTVDGTANLNIYSPGTNPKLKARLPFTVGSNDTILIPSGNTIPDEITIRTTPLSSRISHAEKVFKIDLGLDASGKDLVVSAGGDIKRSYGYENATQAIRLMLETQQGELEQHLDYGFPATIGGRTTDSQIDQIQDLVQQRIISDDRFTTAQVTATFEGSVARVDILARGVAGSGLIPVSYEIGTT